MTCCPKGSLPFLQSNHKDEGRIETAGGVEAYVAGTAKETMLVLVPDVWGWNSGHLRSIADEYAREGAYVAVPKVLQPPFEGGTDGDGLPPDFAIGERQGDLFGCLKQSWNDELVLPKLKKLLAHYAGQGVKRVGLQGFCYGVWISFHVAAQEDLPLEVACGVGAHPSLVIEEGLMGRSIKALAERSRAPFLLQPAGNPTAGGDPAYYDADGDVMKALEAKFPGQNASVRYPGESHGFVTRGDLETGTKIGEGDSTRAAIAKAVGEAKEFFKKHNVY